MRHTTYQLQSRGTVPKSKKGGCAVGNLHGLTLHYTHICIRDNIVLVSVEIVKRDKADNGCKQILQIAQLTDTLHLRYRWIIYIQPLKRDSSHCKVRNSPNLLCIMCSLEGAEPQKFS